MAANCGHRGYPNWRRVKVANFNNFIDTDIIIFQLGDPTAVYPPRPPPFSAAFLTCVRAMAGALILSEGLPTVSALLSLFR
jgi:hypothetical protein